MRVTRLIINLSTKIPRSKHRLQAGCLNVFFALIEMATDTIKNKNTLIKNSIDWQISHHEELLAYKVNQIAAVVGNYPNEQKGLAIKNVLDLYEIILKFVINWARWTVV